MPNQQKANDTKLGLKNKVALRVNSFDGNDAGNVANGSKYLIEMLFVEDFHRDLDLSAIVAGHDRAGVSNARLNIRYGIRNTGEHSGTILRRNKNSNGLDLALVRLRPVDIHDALFVDH